MKYRKSAAPYLLLLVVLIIGIPVVNNQVEKDQIIQIEINEKPVTQKLLPITLK